MKYWEKLKNHLAVENVDNTHILLVLRGERDVTPLEAHRSERKEGKEEAILALRKKKESSKSLHSRRKDPEILGKTSQTARLQQKQRPPKIMSNK